MFDIGGMSKGSDYPSIPPAGRRCGPREQTPGRRPTQTECRRTRRWLTPGRAPLPAVQAPTAYAIGAVVSPGGWSFPAPGHFPCARGLIEVVVPPHCSWECGSQSQEDGAARRGCSPDRPRAHGAPTRVGQAVRSGQLGGVPLTAPRRVGSARPVLAVIVAPHAHGAAGHAQAAEQSGAPASGLGVEDHHDQLVVAADGELARPEVIAQTCGWLTRLTLGRTS